MTKNHSHNTTQPRVYKDTLSKKRFLQKRRAMSWAGVVLLFLVFGLLWYVNWKKYIPWAKPAVEPFQ
ncbi:MAG: hypothetical protein EP343_17125, partial [Deltaproteobacteria bacterium]